MLPEQTPESASSQSRRSLLPAWLVATIALALAACDRPSSSAQSFSASSTVAAEVQKLEIPSSVIDVNDHSTTEERLLMIAEITSLITGNQKREGNAMHTYYFKPDAARADQWQLRQLDVGFGTNDGIRVVLDKQDGKTNWRWEMVDIFTKGDIAFSDNTTTTPTKPVEGTPMTHFDTDRTVDDTTQDIYGAALKQAEAIIEAKVANEGK